MYLLWWNPVFHFPFSGAVTQDFEQRINRLASELARTRTTTIELQDRLGTVTNAVKDIAKKSPIEQEAPSPAMARLFEQDAGLGSPDRRATLIRALLEELKALDEATYGKVIGGLP